MTFKKIEIDGLHEANPIVEVISSVNENFDTLHEALHNLEGGGIIGPVGPKGDPGQDGREGPQGVQGERGFQGEPGPAGQDGKDGKDGANGADGLPGAMGPQGPAGVQGAQGEQGIQGIQGPAGKDGIAGPAGPQGVAGPAGKDAVSGTNLNVSYLTVAAGGGDEGGEILLNKPATNTSIAGTGVIIDVYQNKVRILEQGGTNRGAYIDLTSTGDGVGTNLARGFASGFVNAGQFVQLDNLKFTVTTGGQRGLTCAAVTGTVTLGISASYAMAGGGGASATLYPGCTYTTTANMTGSWFGWSFPNAGDGSTYMVNDYTNKRFYRVHLMIGPGYNNNFISIERLG